MHCPRSKKYVVEARLEPVCRRSLHPSPHFACIPRGSVLCSVSERQDRGMTETWGSLGLATSVLGSLEYSKQYVFTHDCVIFAPVLVKKIKSGLWKQDWYSSSLIIMVCWNILLGCCLVDVKCCRAQVSHSSFLPSRRSLNFIPLGWHLLHLLNWLLLSRKQHLSWKNLRITLN